MQSRQALLERLSKALSSFQESGETFRVVASIPPRQQRSQDPSSSSSSPPSSRLWLPPPPPPRRLIVLDSSFNPPTLAHMRMARSALQQQSEPASQEEDGRGQATTTTAAAEEATIGSATRLLLLLAVNNADKAAEPAEFGHRLGMMYVTAMDLLESLRENRRGDDGDEENATTAGLDGLSVDLGLTTLPYFHSKSEAIAASDHYRPGPPPASSDDDSSRPKTQTNMEQVYLAGYDTLIRIFNPKYYTTGGVGQPRGMDLALGPFFARSRLRITMRADDEWGGQADQRAYVQDLAEGKLEAVGGRREWLDRISLVEGRKPDEQIISSSAARVASQNGDEMALARLVCDDVRRWILEECLYKNMVTS